MSELNLNKLKLQTPNIYEENIKKLKELFPQIVSEDKIDFDILKQLLSNTIVEADDERYRLDWVGKKRSLLKANTPINKTLRPCKEESVDFENTKNLYIEGDNFEVLKLLQESYLNKIKMIYIDPPYNTGKDFVYRDNFTQNKADFEDEIGLRDEEGNKLFKNTDSNGRFHSDWLSMMYERLLVARDLLKDDGVIFISIDDNEVHNLRKICDEVFGEGNFVAEILWQSKSGGGHDEKLIVKENEYILLYSKNKNLTVLGRKLVNNSDKYKLFDEFKERRGGYLLNKLDRRMTSSHYTESLNYPIKTPDNKELWPGGGINRSNEGWNWRWSKTKLEWGLENKFIDFKDNNGNWSIYTKQYEFVDNNGDEIERTLPFRNIIMSSEFSTTQGSGQIISLFDYKIFEYAKTSNLIAHLIKIANIENNDLILDFFSGSATTAHAVMDLNAQDGGNRKFIMVQIPENTDEKSEAYKAGYKNICEIGKERIKRAGAKILEDNKDKDLSSLDIGFRVLKVDSSSMKDIYYHPNEIKQNQLKMFETNIKEDRSDLDLLFSIMLDLGITLDLKITTKIIDDKKLYFIENSELIVCFEENITLKIIEAIKEEKPYKIVLKDGCFANDTQKINAILELSLISSISVI